MTMHLVTVPVSINGTVSLAECQTCYALVRSDLAELHDNAAHGANLVRIAENAAGLASAGGQVTVSVERVSATDGVGD